MSLLTYTDVRPWARSIKSAILTGQMPPWKPVNSHGVFKGERSLTADAAARAGEDDSFHGMRLVLPSPDSVVLVDCRN